MTHRVFRFLFIVVLWVAGAVPSHALEPDDAPSPTPKPFAATSNQSFADVEHWQKVFDNPERDKWQRPAEVVKALGLKKGAVVADLGAGTGYFMPYLSAAAGENGTVFAVSLRSSRRCEQDRGGMLIPASLRPRADPCHRH